MRLPTQQAEEIKKQHGYAVQSEVRPDEHFTIQPFGDDKLAQISRADLAFIIEARMEEIMAMVLKEIKRSGYDGLLPAGVVFTGGGSALPGLRSLANRIIELPARIAQPENMVGMVDKIQSPAFSTSMGLIRWALLMNEFMAPTERHRTQSTDEVWDKVKNFFIRFLP